MISKDLSETVITLKCNPKIKQGPQIIDIEISPKPGNTTLVANNHSLKEKTQPYKDNWHMYMCPLYKKDVCRHNAKVET